MSPKSLSTKAVALVSKAHPINDPVIIDHAQAQDPESNKSVHRFKVVSAAEGNAHPHIVLMDDHGEPLESTNAPFDVHVLTAMAGSAPAAPITISPNVNVLTLNPGDTLDETITVTIPKNAGPAQADVYFLADTTGSMGSILSAVQTGANNVLTALNGLGVNLVFGVGNYKDFASGDPYGFKHQVSPTSNAATVTAAINAWSAAGGGDIPEAALFALDSLAVPPGGSIGWRSGSKRIIVWFGDAPSHDPICSAVTGGAPTVTEASATAKLVAEGIAVLAISTATPGLDDDPKSGASGYAACGGPGGSPGQATRIATKTGGAFVTGINAGNIVNTIISLVSGAVGSIKNVNLVPSPTVAPFITSITPAGGYGPLAGDQDHTLAFDVKFAGVPCQAKEQVITGTIDVVADGKVVATKRVRITVPPCAFIYSIKFVCGVQTDCACECSPVQPGQYATEINIHNFTAKDIEITQAFIPVVLAGAPAGRPPHTAKSLAQQTFTLPHQSATMVDCCTITELLFGGPASTALPLTIGFLELTASAEIAVTAVYTTSGLKPGGVSIDVQQIAGQRQ